MLIFPLKKEWYKKIKSGEKTIEYREVKPYWSIRIFNEISKNEISKDDPIIFEPADSFALQCVFRLGYGTEKISAIITKIEIIDGKNTDLHIDRPVYAIHFKQGA